MLDINERIDKLPPLPNIIFKLQYIQNSNDHDHKKILELIEKDSFISTKILQMANSKLFGFNNSVKTVSKALNLYGTTFTIDIALSELIKNSIKVDLDIYNIQAKRFFDLSDYSCRLMLDWLDKEDISLKKRLIFPCLIHEIGKFIISSSLNENEKKEFLQLSKESNDISSLERKFTGFSSSEVTSLLLKKWDFDKQLCEDVFYIDSAINTKVSLILNVIKTIFNVNNPLSKQSIFLGMQKAKQYSLDDVKLQQCIEKILINSIPKN